MAIGGTITQRITDLIGEQHSTDAVYSTDLINAAINEVADMLPKELLMKYSSSPTAVTSGTGASIEGKKVLKVIRVDANTGGIERECKELGRTEYAQARDSGSIHYATVFSPVYNIDSMNTASNLDIFPDCNGSGQEGNIWTFSYIPDAENTVAMTAALLSSSYFLPSELIHAIALKSSVNILKAYISNQIQDEEDSEMLQMIQAQVQLLEKDYGTELQRFVPQTEKPQGE
jgi:hypothetical protein